ncbi:hypothetical protein [Pseudomonas siliginis]|uniref:hypothetical protein n=1 Tax=Pseudomonas siliginis TaxID=2842346 RepID=UPI002092D8F2|nr:hypothetical protein [Pseudomonas siliginis]UST80109.1 hypothetical protein NF676_01965 [Pseudomonas siliginis]
MNDDKSIRERPALAVSGWICQASATSAAKPDLPENIKNAAVFVSIERLRNGPLYWPRRLQSEKQGNAVMFKRREQATPESYPVVSTTLSAEPASTLVCHQAREHTGSRVVP